MKAFWTLALGMLVVFSGLFAIAHHLGCLEPAFVEASLQSVRSSRAGQLAVGAVIILLLVADLLLPIPSSLVMALAGKFLGAPMGIVVTFVGAMLAAALGFYACRLGGQPVFRRLAGTRDTQAISRWFDQYGIYAIILSRPIPMLTEILSCLAGLSTMNAHRFFVAAILGTLPVCIIYSMVGSLGSLTNPWPAVWVSLVIPAAGWLLVRRIKRPGPTDQPGD